MIHNISGDALIACKGGILCHQTNYFGVMGAGIAYAIRTKLLDKEAYRAYVDLCKLNGESLLGVVQFLYLNDGDIIVANCFSQRDMDNAYPNGRIKPLTDYNYVRICFEVVRNCAEKTYHCPVYIPYKYGCGIAGGDWSKVQEIINDVFKDSLIDVYIVRRSQD